MEAFRDMCEATIAEYDGTAKEYAADWAREALCLLAETER